jgi:hypothetical protein
MIRIVEGQITTLVVNESLRIKKSACIAVSSTEKTGHNGHSACERQDIMCPLQLVAPQLRSQMSISPLGILGPE